MRGDEVIRTACPHNCWDTCALDVTVRDGRIIDVDGASDCDITAGFCCSKARLLARSASDPGRPLSPLRRRQSGRYEPISWTDALDLVAERLLSVRSRTGGRGILYHSSTGSQGALKDLDRRFWNLFGGVTRPSGSLCWSAGLAAQRADFGANRTHHPTDHAEARTVIIWGRNPFATSPHLVPILNRARAGGAHAVVIDPLLTRTARWADERLRPAPGTDHLLALVACRIVLRRGWLDSDYAAANVDGYDPFVRWIEGHPADDILLAGTGVSPVDAERLAELYRAGRPVATLVGYGMQRHRHGGLAIRLIDALAALTGNLGLVGGGVSYAGLLAREWLGDVDGPPGDHRFIPWPRLVAGISEASPPVEMLISARSNPVTQLPASVDTVRVLERIGFRVVIDHRWTETAELSDVFLPVSLSFEEEDLFTSSWHHNITWGMRAVSPPPGVRSDLEIWAELAARLGFGGEFSGDPRRWLDRLTAPLGRVGLGSADLRGRTVRHPGVPSVPWDDGQFLTVSGRCELVTGEPVAPGTARGQRFSLITPRHPLTTHSQFFGRAESGPLPRVRLSPDDAEKLGMVNGDRVSVRSDTGQLTAVVAVDPIVLSGTAVMIAGGDPAQGMGANALTGYSSTDIGDCIAYYDTLVSISRS